LLNDLLQIANKLGLSKKKNIYILSCCFPTKELELESQEGKGFSVLQIIQTVSEAHPELYPMGTKGSFHENRAAKA
jgi:hypothetical protein